MTPEIYTIIGVAIALAALILNGQRAIAELRKDLNALRGRVNGDISALGERVHGDIAALGQRVCQVEGLLEGIREAIKDRTA